MVCLQMPNVKLIAVKYISLTGLIYCTSVGPEPVNPPTCSDTLMATSEIIQVSMLFLNNDILTSWSLTAAICWTMFAHPTSVLSWSEQGWPVWILTARMNGGVFLSNGLQNVMQLPYVLRNSLCELVEEWGCWVDAHFIRCLFVYSWTKFIKACIHNKLNW